MISINSFIYVKNKSGPTPLLWITPLSSLAIEDLAKPIFDEYVHLKSCVTNVTSYHHLYCVQKLNNYVLKFLGFKMSAVESETLHPNRKPSITDVTKPVVMFLYYMGKYFRDQKQYNNIYKLVLNSAAHVVTKTPKFYCTIPILNYLHLLKVNERNKCKVLSHLHINLSKLTGQPSYLCSLLSVSHRSNRSPSHITFSRRVLTSRLKIANRSHLLLFCGSVSHLVYVTLRITSLFHLSLVSDLSTSLALNFSFTVLFLLSLYSPLSYLRTDISF